MRYVFSAAVALALVMGPATANAGLHVIHALIEAHKAKHDSLFEKLRHHHAMKPKKKLKDHFKHGHGHHGHHGHHRHHGAGGCPTCH